MQLVVHQRHNTFQILHMAERTKLLNSCLKAPYLSEYIVHFFLQELEHKN